RGHPVADTIRACADRLSFTGGWRAAADCRSLRTAAWSVVPSAVVWPRDEPVTGPPQAAVGAAGDGFLDGGPPVARAVAHVQAPLGEPAGGANVAVGVAVEAAALGRQVGVTGPVGGGAGLAGAHGAVSASAEGSTNSPSASGGPPDS